MNLQAHKQYRTPHLNSKCKELQLQLSIHNRIIASMILFLCFLGILTKVLIKSI